MNPTHLIPCNCFFGCYIENIFIICSVNKTFHLLNKNDPQAWSLLVTPLIMFDFATTRQRKIVTKTQTTHNVISLVRGVRSFSSLYIIMCSVVLWKQKYFWHMLSVIILRLNLISLGKLVLLIRQNWRLSATLNCQDIRSVKNKFRRNRIFFHNSVLCLPSFMSLWCQDILL